MCVASAWSQVVSSLHLLQQIWDSGRALSALLRGDEFKLKGRRVLELGSGTGIGGLTAAALGAHTILTDKPEQMGLLESNIALNGLESNARAEVLWWGDAPSASDQSDESPFDLVCGSDLLYAPHVFGSLLETLAKPSVTRAGTELLLTFPMRFTEDIFLEQALELFEEVSWTREVEAGIYAAHMRRRDD